MSRDEKRGVVYEAILLPTDGSEGTTAAARHAGELAETYGATVHVLSVIDGSDGFGSPSSATQAWTDAERERATRAINETIASLPESVTTESAVRAGDPMTQILQYVDDQPVDLTVMGTHGRTGLDHYLIGSVAEKIVRRSPVPVMTVRLTDPTE